MNFNIFIIKWVNDFVQTYVYHFSDADRGTQCVNSCSEEYVKCTQACRNDENCRIECSVNVASCIDDWNGQNLEFYFGVFFLISEILSDAALATKIANKGVRVAIVLSVLVLSQRRMKTSLLAANRFVEFTWLIL